jgi:hypothetical protein
MTWVMHSRRESEKERYEMLHKMFTETRFKQKVFLALKEGIEVEKDEKFDGKFGAWRNWCDMIKYQKFFKRAKYLTNKMSGERNTRLVKQVFDAIKYNKVNERLEKAAGELAVEKPLRQNLES